jgi:hypothetical protein
MIRMHYEKCYTVRTLKPYRKKRLFYIKRLKEEYTYWDGKVSHGFSRKLTSYLLRHKGV